ncbi:MAG: cysteine proteinase inhibitor 5-like [Chlorobi bacterium]|nr:cysteine proteinase inhibitor 5-like [Chlorobiota bacterium]
MKSIQRITAMVALLVMMAAARPVHAQVAGGWSNAPVRDPGVVAAARFAVEEHGRQEPVTLKKIVRARQQVVAGTNYEVTLLVKRGKGSRKAVAVVWHKTDDTYNLTSWKWAGGK